MMGAAYPIGFIGLAGQLVAMLAGDADAIANARPLLGSNVPGDSDLRAGTKRSSDEALGQSVPDFTGYRPRRSRAFCRSPRPQSQSARGSSKRRADGK